MLNPDRKTSRGFDSMPPEAPARPARVRRSRPAPPQNHERWLVSYADFITLLFAVFTTMYALSALDAQKFATMAVSLQRAFNGGPVTAGKVVGLSAVSSPQPAAPPAEAVPPAATPAAVPAPPPAAARAEPPAPARSESATPQAELENVRTRLRQGLAGAIAAGQVSLEMDHRGLVISIREAASFAVSRAELSAAAQAILREIGQSLVPIDNRVRIEGHTDDRPIHTDRFTSNWELSTARATTVVRFMIEQAGVPPARLSAAGYAEFVPRAAGTSPDARARNRRIDVVVLSQPIRAAEEPR